MRESSELSLSGHLHAGGGEALVQLDPDHPGFNDKIYRTRRDTIAQLALDYRDTDPVPHAEYIEQEQEVWREVWRNLEPEHEQYACKEAKEALATLDIDKTRIPQLQEINDIIEPMHGFRMLPVAGLVESAVFLRYLARPVFLSTQYIRHYSRPLYTPEPDIVHELVGHSATFTHPEFCKINRAFGNAALRTDDPKMLARIGRLYWFTLEFGVVTEGDQLKACGAGLLSSFGELQQFEKDADLHDFDPEEIVETEYDPTGYQGVLFVAPSFGAMMNHSLAWLARI